MTTILASGTVYIRYTSSPSPQIQYSTDNQASWTDIAFAPSGCTIDNTDLSTTLKVIFTTDIELLDSDNFFICGSSNIQFGSTSLNANGTRPIIKKRIGSLLSSYSGFIRNGTAITNGYNNITIVNLVVDGTGMTLFSLNGWIAQEYFANSAINNKIINCSSKGNINVNSGGGIVGAFAGANNGELIIIGCSSIGNISGNLTGGIVGATSQNITATECFSLGIIGSEVEPNGAGGIFGGSASPNNQKNCHAEKCYSKGNMAYSTRIGGIFAPYYNQEGANTCTNCYSHGNLPLPAGCGGIMARPININNTPTNVTNCYSIGNIINPSQVGVKPNGGILAGNTSGLSTDTVNNCYTSGQSLVAGTPTPISGIFANESQDNLLSRGTGNYSEANSGLNDGQWNDANAVITLQDFGTVWLSLSPDTPYILNQFGVSPYTINNVTPGSYTLVKTFSQTVEAGSSTTTSALGIYTNFYIFPAGSDPSITINSTTGIISTTTATPPGTYNLIIYAEVTELIEPSPTPTRPSHYTTTNFILTVTEPQPPSPQPIQITQTIPPCCEANVCNKNPQSSNYNNDVIARKQSSKVINSNVQNFYEGVATGKRTAYSQPVFKSYYDYIQFLQSKTR